MMIRTKLSLLCLLFLLAACGGDDTSAPTPPVTPPEEPVDPPVEDDDANLNANPSDDAHPFVTDYAIPRLNAANEYYFGSSAYQNNFDFRINAWQGQGTYPGMQGEELTALMWERLPQSFPHALETLYPNAAPVDGMDVFYTINFGIYDGSTKMYTIQYKVVGQGQFEYVEGSLKVIE